MKTTFNYTKSNKSLNSYKTTSDFMDKYAASSYSGTQKKAGTTAKYYKIYTPTTSATYVKPKTITADNSWLIDYFDTYNIATGEFKKAGYSEYTYTPTTKYYTISNFSKFFNDFDDYEFYDEDGNKIEYFDNFIRISNAYDIKIIPTAGMKAYSLFKPIATTKPIDKKIIIKITLS